MKKSWASLNLEQLEVRDGQLANIRRALIQMITGPTPDVWGAKRAQEKGWGTAAGRIWMDSS